MRRLTIALALTTCLVSAADAQLCGDCNMDGQLSILDALKTAQIASGLQSPVPADFLFCDVDGNGQITILDALLIAQFVAGLPAILQCPNPGMPPDCNILNPQGGSFMGEVPVSFSAADPDSATLDYVFEFSTNGGGLWAQAATNFASTPPFTSNPTLGVPPGLYNWSWDSAADIAGASAALIRLTVSDGSSMASCQTASLQIDNTGFGALPSCNITSPVGGTVSNDVSISFTTADMDTPNLSVSFSYSTNGGMNFQFAPVAMGSPPPYSMNPTMMAPVGAGTFIWDSSLGITGMESVRFRIMVSDMQSTTVCTSDFIVDNTPPGAPSCMITSPMGGSFDDDITIQFTTADVDTPNLNVRFEYSSNGGSNWQFASVAPASMPPYATNPSPSAPTGAGTFVWDSASDVPMVMLPVEFRIIVEDGISQSICMTDFDVDNRPMVGQPPSCNITSPVGGTEDNDVSIVFTTTDPDSPTLDVIFQFSSDGGMSFANATVSAASMAPYDSNPAMSVPVGGGTFVWRSSADLPMLMSPVTFRIRVFDSSSMAECTSTFTVDNAPMMGQPPSCNISGPMGGTESDDVSVTFTLTDPDSPSLNVGMRFSTDGGMTWMTPSVSPASMAPFDTTPVIGAPTGAGTFVWDSANNIAGLASVTFEITVNDGFSSSNCSTMFDVDNTPMGAMPPSCMINSPMGGTEMADISINFTTVDPDSPTLNISFEFSTNMGSIWEPATVAAASMAPLDMNPATAVPVGTRTFIWASKTDIAMTAAVMFRLVISDGFTLAECMTSFNIDNTMVIGQPPSCVINNPMGGTRSGAVAVNFNTMDPDSPTVGVTIEYSTGGPFMLCTTHPSSPSPLGTNPAMNVPVGTAGYFWNSAVDIPGMAAVTLRVTVDDGTTTSTCTSQVTIDNTMLASALPSCNISSPVSTVEFGRVTIDFTTTDPDNAVLEVTFEYSTDGGQSWLFSTTDMMSPMPYDLNPATMAPTGAGTYIWDTRIDLPMMLAGVVFRITVSDGVSQVTCPTGFVVDNMQIPPPQAGEILISEVLQDPASVADANGEWFEIRSIVGMVVDLNGCIIRDDGGESHTINHVGPLFLNPGQRLVFGNNGDFNSNGNVDVDYEYSGIQLANGDDEIIIEDPRTNEVVRIDYNGGPAWPSPVGASMILERMIFDHLFANNGYNWCVSSSPWLAADLGSPGNPNDSCFGGVGSPQAEDVIFNEIHADPHASLGDANGDSVSNDDDEFVELLNISSSTQDISNCTIDVGTGTRHIFPPNTFLRSGRAVVIFGGSRPVGVFGGSQVFTASTGSLGIPNSFNTVFFKNPGGSIINSYNYGAEAMQDQSIVSAPEPTVMTPPASVRPLQIHTGQGIGLRFSPGTKVDGSGPTW